MSGSGERPRSARRFIEDGFAASLLAVDTSDTGPADEGVPPFVRFLRFVGDREADRLDEHIRSLGIDVDSGSTCVYFPVGIEAGALVLRPCDREERIIVPATPDSLVVIAPETAFDLPEGQPIVMPWPG